VGDHPNGLRVSQAWKIAAIKDGKDASFRLDGSVGRLIENAPHMSVPLRGVRITVHSGGLLLARAGTHPGREVSRRRKRSPPWPRLQQ